MSGLWGLRRVAWAFVLSCAPMRWMLFSLLLCVTASAQGAGMSYGIPFADRVRFQDGRAVVRMQPLALAVRALARSADGTLVVKYPGNAQGSLAVHELRSCLVALGVPSSRLRLVPGSPAGNAFVIHVTSGGVATP